MQSRAHAAIGAVVSLVPVLVLWPGAGLAAGAALWTYGVAVSVLVDLDHFLITRVRVGDWRHLRRVLANPAGALWDQAWIFDEDDLTGPDRLLTHALLGGALVAAWWPVAPPLSVFTALVIAVHVLADVLRDHEWA